MTSKTRNRYLITSLISVFVMAVAILFGGKNTKFKPFSVRGSTPLISNSITFNSFSNVGGHAECTKTLANGGGIKAYSTTMLDDGAVYVSNTDLLLFSFQNNGVENSQILINNISRECAPFQNLKTIKVSFSGGASTITANYSINGTSWSSVNVYNNFTNSSVDGAKYLYFSTSSSYARITSLVLSYECSFGPAPTVTSISVVVNKTQFYVGDSFSFEGTVTAHYSDTTSTDVTNDAEFSGFNSSAIANNQVITVSFGGETTTYLINIIENTSDYLEGTYALSNYPGSTTLAWKLEFYSNLTGIYRKYNSSGTVIGTDTFRYSLDGGTINFTNVTSTYNNWGNYYLTHGTTATSRGTTNTGTVSGNVISITTYSTNGSVTRAATYTKAG